MGIICLSLFLEKCLVCVNTFKKAFYVNQGMRTMPISRETLLTCKKKKATNTLIKQVFFLIIMRSCRRRAGQMFRDVSARIS